MKKVLMAVTAVALSGCMLFAFAGCGAASKAKNLKGEEVTEDVWDAAMAASAYQTSSADVPYETVAAAPETAEAPNYQVEYEMIEKGEFASEGGTIGSVTFDASEAKIDMSASVTVTVADNAMHLSMKYNFKIEGSENLLSAMQIPEGMNGSGEAELYVSFADGMTVIVKDADGNWVKASLESSSLAAAVQLLAGTVMGLIDQSGLVGAFAEYQYSAEDKGYTLIDADVSGSLGESSLSAGANTVLKIKDNRLAAIYSYEEMNVDILGITSSGTSESGLVYTYGGQSVTLPTVA